MKVVCYGHACYERIYYERDLIRMVCYEQVCFEMEPDWTVDSLFWTF